jgi:hypothetical protein
MPRNASKSSRTFAQSGLRDTENRPFDEMTKALRSLAETCAGCASQPVPPAGADTCHAPHIANKTAGKKMFFFFASIGVYAEYALSERGERVDRRFVSSVVEVCTGIFFRAGC